MVVRWYVSWARRKLTNRRDECCGQFLVLSLVRVRNKGNKENKRSIWGKVTDHPGITRYGKMKEKREEQQPLFGFEFLGLIIVRQELWTWLGFFLSTSRYDARRYEHGVVDASRIRHVSLWWRWDAMHGRFRSRVGPQWFDDQRSQCGNRQPNLPVSLWYHDGRRQGHRG